MPVADTRHALLRPCRLGCLLLLAGLVLAAGAAEPKSSKTAPPLEFDPPGGFFANPTAVTLKAASSGAVVRYTTDGREPTAQSPVFQVPIRVDRSLYIRARAFRSDQPSGEVLGAAYILLGEDALAFNSNLPILVVSTFGGHVLEDDKRPAWLTAIDNGNSRASIQGDIQFQGRIGLEYRGSSSMRLPKRSFGLEIRDETTEDDKKAALLGLPADSDWVLYAPYSDKSLMRNVLSYELWEAMGHYSVRCRFVELFFQEDSGALRARDYAGVYVLIEKIKQGKQRVNIAKLSATDIYEPEVSGGYILKKDRMDPNDNPFRTAWGHTLGIEYPKGDKLNDAQKRWIRNWFNEFESALMGNDFRDPQTGYRKYLEVATAIDYFWIVEMSKTIDGFTFSVFMHKDRSGKLVLSPIWDRNLSFGNVDYQAGDDPYGWYSDHVRGRDLWYGRLFRDPEFAQAVVDRWGELRRKQFATTNVLARVDAYAALLDEAKEREFARWPRLGVYVWPNGAGDWPNKTYAGTLQYLKDFIVRRLDWIDRQYVPSPGFSQKPSVVPPGFHLALTGATNTAHTLYYSIHGIDPRQAGGEVHPLAAKYQGPFRVYGKTRVCARIRNLQGAWGPLLVGVYVVDVP